MTRLQTDRLVYSDRDLDNAGVLSRKTRWRLRRDGKFPRARQVGGRKYFVATEVMEWLDDPDKWAERHGDAG